MRTDNVSPILAAWLHIGPEDQPADGPAIGVQRLHIAEVSESLRDNPVSLSFLPGHLASDIVHALVAIGGEDAIGGNDWHVACETVQAMMTVGNCEVSIGRGMVATITPAEPTSGVNLSRAEPVLFAFPDPDNA